MKVETAELYKTVYEPDGIAKDPRPKVVFLGRSNVGKSSLINHLLRRKRLAKTAATPGKTVSINYYLIENRFFFVDLPGYGYVKLNRSERRRVSGLISSFFDASENLALLVLLIDIRRGFLRADLETLEKVLEIDADILTVLTKSDKMSVSQVNTRLHDFHKKYNLVAIPFSVKSTAHRETLLAYIKESLTG